MTRLPTVLCLALLPAVHAAEAPSRQLLQPPVALSPSPVTDRFALVAGAAWNSMDTRMRIDDPAPFAGTAFDAESDLGLPSRQQTAQVELFFRFGELSRLRVDYLQMQRAASSVLPQTLRIREQVYNAGTTVGARASLRTLGFDYSRAMFRNARGELALSAGLRFSEGEARIESAAQQQALQAEAVLPVPTLGLDGTWNVRERWSVNARMQLIVAGRDDVEAALARLQADVQYRLFDNLAVGLGYNRLDVEADSGRVGDSGRVRVKAGGPALFLRASF
jgi:hypothetical protein